MTDNISWVEVKLSDAKVGKLISKIVLSKRAIETGGCGCGCDSAPADKDQLNHRVKQG